MFEALSGKLSGVFDGLAKQGALSEADVLEAMREVRLAMLDADVALPVVKDFVNKVKERAIGHEVLESISPGQAVAKIVNDALIDALGGAGAVPLNLNSTPPVPVLMVGLQGSGKTTTSGKLALRLKTRERKKVLLASLDTQRPAAQLQLAQLAEQVGVTSLPIIAGQTPVEIAKRALDTGRLEGYDVVILDTAGRLSIDEALMDEVRQIRDVTHPAETLLVVDAMTGQDAVNTAKAFNEAVGVTGVVMTRMDGDSRGGAALSMRAITGAPIKLIGKGEKLDGLDEFYPERVAGRILGLGDIAGLVEKAADTLDQEEGERLAQKMMAGKFDLDDYASQIRQINKLGSISGILGMLPGMGKVKEALGDKDLDTSILKKHLAIISSMTKAERKKPAIIKASRKKRIAAGSGSTVQDVNKLLKQFDMMSSMMKRFNKLGLKGLMRQGMSALMPKGMGGGGPPGGPGGNPFR
ncbi:MULTISPECIES: signal recognition particle protein [Acetobacter]|uniref:Signal recognition particle protein n=3 Tax=Acetobacter TaxID=434 RepID=A0AAN1UAA1_9PROT|nr:MULTISPECIES: signal recognition particle protein [Acetobacter]ASL41715.1 signal recognition particle protein [Acetobacter oryzifermentans]AXN01657.1 signal recognition particle protein [Acetobacter pomorum]KAA8397322.1 signal recognition particle protein [Acetobacter sp. DmW_125128]KAA8397478.1 signal recognition particle protein [Acetobacter sp. DmW_125127]KAA8399053.1 signal recognition particle protein [Acetobacter sp. DmW_125124]